ncbi:MAG: hypothetical protein OQK04_10080 [Kangiellaceae bacterium]|nr:hypothetical protein [Kangiellaceae bacterium]MCW8999052.1 hypothetical protein [Kangiellaceae bacterium]
MANAKEKDSHVNSAFSSRKSKLLQQIVELDDLERSLINELQGDLPLVEKPFLAVADKIGSTEQEVIKCLQQLLDKGVITRFGPLFDISKGSGCFSLCALKVPESRISEVTEVVNSFTQVAHNYLRENEWNMWFVLACEDQKVLTETFDNILLQTQCRGINCPKEKEFFIGLYLPV